MEFRIIYEGILNTASRNNTRADEKHAIRSQFHPQLKRLWHINNNLQQFAEHQYIPLPDSTLPEHLDRKARAELGFEAIGQKWVCGNFNFVPLVTSEHNLRCSLDITLLRPEEERFIFRQGDIDGQLKTLFDSLKTPQDSQEIDGFTPKTDEHPFFCLLEDDRLISEVKVITDQLLLLPNTRETKANEAHVVIHVKLNHKNARTFDNIFG